MVVIFVSLGLLTSCTNDFSQLEERVSQIEEKQSVETVLMRLNQTTTDDICTACGCSIKKGSLNCSCTLQSQYDCLKRKGKKRLWVEPFKAAQ